MLYILINKEEKKSFVATGIKSLSEQTGVNYNTLTSYLRGVNFYANDKLVVCRIDRVSKQNKKGNTKNLKPFHWYILSISSILNYSLNIDMLNSIDIACLKLDKNSPNQYIIQYITLHIISLSLRLRRFI